MPVSTGVTQGVTQPVPPRPASAPERAPAARRPAPYLQRRGQVFYFRKRLSRRAARLTERSEFVVSLRTTRVGEARMRAARVLVELQRAETRMSQLDPVDTLEPEQAKRILAEVARRGLGDLLARHDSGDLFEDDADLLIAEIAARIDRLKAAARTRDFSAIADALRQAAAAFQVDLSDPVPTRLGLDATRILVRLAEIERRAIDLDDPRDAAQPLAARFSDGSVDDFVKPPVSLSDALARMRANSPSPAMKGNHDALEQLLLEFFGDGPVSRFTEDEQKRFFAWAARLPSSHGKSHGKNRFSSDGRARTKRQEIDAADARDERVLEEIRQLDCSDAEKRARLGSALVPRLSLKTLQRYRDSLARLIKASAELGAHPLKVLGYRELRAILHAQHNASDPLSLRVTQQKTRLPWSEERQTAFLTSPIFTGHATLTRRWQRGNLITRDATYWLPLLWMCLGTRHEEVIQVQRQDLVYRNGVHGLLIGWAPEQKTKTEDAKRFLPLSDLLIELGFVEWVHSLPDAHGPLLFPEAAGRSTVGKASEAFSKHMSRLLSHLGLKDFDEDFYALRKTFLTALDSNGVSDGKRKALAGHRDRDVTNVHYTANDAKDLKKAVDLVTAHLGIRVVYSPRHGFPPRSG